MKRIFASLVVCLAMISPGTSSAFADDLDAGMLAWPQGEMASALSRFIPRRMAEDDVPGLAIAVVMDGHIVFEQGYGTADVSGSVPVTPNTLFEAASLGKPVVALGALGMVADGALSLDAPLGPLLDVPWLGDEDDHHQITLRQVLTHTSGLSNFVWCCSDESWSTPGALFSYSGVGYMYLGHVLAHVSDMPFDKFMRAHVFGPLNMVSSGYGLPEPLVGTVARGFVPLVYPLMVFFVPLALIFLALSIATVLVVRFGLHRLKLELMDFAGAAAVSLVATLLFIALLLGLWGFLFILAYVIAFSVLFFGMSLLLLVVFAFMGLLGPADGTLARGQQRRDPVVSMIAFGLAFVGAYFFLFGQNVPVPVMAGDTINPAFSLRSSAHDLGLFVEGVVEGKVSGASLRDRAFADTVDIGNGIGWGLGFGVREGATGRTGWQWGSNPGFESLMVIDPNRRAGVIILTNSSKAAFLVQEIAGHVMGETPGWRLP